MNAEQAANLAANLLLAEGIARACLVSMDVPHLRRDVTRPENVRWLLRNVRVRNHSHPLLGQTMVALRKVTALHREAT